MFSEWGSHALYALRTPWSYWRCSTSLTSSRSCTSIMWSWHNNACTQTQTCICTTNCNWSWTSFLWIISEPIIWMMSFTFCHAEADCYSRFKTVQYVSHWCQRRCKIPLCAFGWPQYDTLCKWVCPQNRMENLEYCNVREFLDGPHQKSIQLKVMGTVSSELSSTVVLDGCWAMLNFDKTYATTFRTPAPTLWLKGLNTWMPLKWNKPRCSVGVELWEAAYFLGRDIYMFQQWGREHKWLKFQCVVDNLIYKGRQTLSLSVIWKEKARVDILIIFWLLKN